MLDFENLENSLKIKFKNPNLLKEALTHRSFLNENPKEKTRHNERLEFLGDAVLELSTTEFLFFKYPLKTEGELTSLRAALVNSNMLYEVAKRLHLENYLRVSKGESKDSGKGKQYILANSVEALIGAIYLDQGYKAADEFIKKYISSNLEKIVKEKLWIDPKSLFQEKAQEFLGITPRYQVLSESGPDHNKYFIIGVYLENELIAKGGGFSKQDAEMKAASEALRKKGWNKID